MTLEQARAEALDELLGWVEDQLKATPAEKAWAAGTHTSQEWPVWPPHPVSGSGAPNAAQGNVGTDQGKPEEDS